MKLVGYERWMADAVARRQAIVRSPRVLAAERRFGARGVALLAAGMASIVLAELIAIVGVVVVAMTRTPGVVLLALAIAVLAIGAVRIGQGVSAGRSAR